MNRALEWGESGREWGRWWGLEWRGPLPRVRWSYSYRYTCAWPMHDHLSIRTRISCIFLLFEYDWYIYIHYSLSSQEVATTSSYDINIRHQLATSLSTPLTPTISTNSKCCRYLWHHINDVILAQLERCHNIISSLNFPVRLPPSSTIYSIGSQSTPPQLIYRNIKGELAKWCTSCLGHDQIQS